MPVNMSTIAITMRVTDKNVAKIGLVLTSNLDVQKMRHDVDILFEADRMAHDFLRVKSQKTKSFLNTIY